VDSLSHPNSSASPATAVNGASQPIGTVSAAQAAGVAPVIRAPDELALKELQQTNAHAQATQKAEQGWIGAIFGAKSEKSGNVAAFVIVLCFIFIFLAAYREADAPSETFFKLLSPILGLIGLALGYLFGSSDRK
jgi:hypothetical protein